MKTKGIILAAGFLVVVVVFSGCVDCSTNEDCEDGLVCSEDGTCVESVADAFDVYHSGVEGLSAELVSPAGELAVEQSFTVQMEVTNKGSHTLDGGKKGGDAYAFLSGVSWDVYGADSWKKDNYDADLMVLYDNNENELTGVSKETGGSVVGIESYLFGNKQLTVPVEDKSQKKSIELTMCYPYETKARARVCIGESSDTASCVNKGAMQVDSWAAPIVVTRVEEISAGKTNPKHTFKIYIENKGAGMAFDDTGVDVEDCMDTTKYTASVKDKVWVKEITLKGVVVCKSASTNPLLVKPGKEYVIICSPTNTYPGTAADANLEITLSYGYKQSQLVSLQVLGI